MSLRGKYSRDERGVVSLLTVMFFMVFISLIVVGYVTLVVYDQRQTTDSDLSASALAAAKGGIEEGKRVLLYCRSLQVTNPTAYATSGCSSVMNNTSCDAFKAPNPGSTLATTLKIPISADGEGVTGGSAATDYRQYFSCMTIQTQTPTVSSPVTKDRDFIQKLQTVSAFTNLKVSWSGDGTYTNRTSAVTSSSPWTKLADWNNGTDPYMPVIALQIIQYTSLGDLDAVERDSRTVFIVPCTNGVPACSSANKGISTLDNRSAMNPFGTVRASGAPVPAAMPITYADCTVTPGLNASYHCSVILQDFNGGNPGGTQYYARAKVLYADQTLLELQPQDGSGTPINFDNVQPWIDATGRTNDVFRRVRAQVSYSVPNVPLPSNALDSAAPICKNMTVTNVAATTTFNCN